MNYINKHSSKLALAAVIICALVIGRDLLSSEFFSSHDGLYHVIRLHQFDLSFRSGQFPVRWAPSLLGGIGYPLFIVNYTLPYYIAEFLLLITNSYFWSIKLTLLLSLVGGAVSSYMVFKSWGNRSFPALIGSILYTIAPYRLANIFERGAVGESFAYVFAPLLFHSSFLVLLIGFTGIILSHTVIAMMFIPIALLYQPKKKTLLAIVIACGLSAFQLMPIIFERHYMKFDENLLAYYLGHFRPITQLLRIPFANINLGTRFQVGIVHSLVIILGIYYALIKSSQRRRIIFFIGITLVSLFLITSPSKTLWSVTPLARYILYPWRWLGVIAFTTSSVAVLILTSRRSLLIGISMVLLALFAYRHYLKADQIIPAKFPTSMLYGNGTTQNEFDPIWYENPPKFNSPIESLVLPSSITSIDISPNHWQANTHSSTNSEIRFNLLYFPGWQVAVDSLPTTIYPTNGLIHIMVPAGTHHLDAKFTDTPVRRLGNLITIIFGISVLGYYALRLRPH